MTDKKKTSGVKIYDRPKIPPSKVKGMIIVGALLALLVLAVLAFYLLV